MEKVDGSWRRVQTRVVEIMGKVAGAEEASDWVGGREREGQRGEGDPHFLPFISTYRMTCAHLSAALYMHHGSLRWNVVVDFCILFSSCPLHLVTKEGAKSCGTLLVG